MKTNDINNAMPWLQINECLRALPEMRPAHSKGKSEVPTTTHICVRFAPPLMVEFKIKQLGKISRQIPPIGPVPLLPAAIHSSPVES